MPLDLARVRQRLQKFDFRPLFTQELGWDKHNAGVTVAVDGQTFCLQPIAEKRGFQVFECPPGSNGAVPDHPTRSKIERQVAKSAHEHIIIYTDAGKTVQKWQWVRRELGRPLARREYDFFQGHTGELLAQKLQYLAVDLAEEEKLNLVHVAQKAKQAFDIDRVTKRFYDRFQTEHAAFLKFIKGITAVADAEWYASLMLNRLMFIYFIQKKGFLDGDTDYLRNRLRRVQSERGKDKFLTFYQYFLLRLFHEGLGQPPAQRKKDLDKLLGVVPYLNGGLFEVHDLERAYPGIQIADEAFEKLFNFFDAYQWHLDERPLRDDYEINPDVLGYIFEKYINQKQMGAYYTKEDITGYITRNTLIPFLFNAAEKKCAIAFRPESAPWRLLRDDPDRYIYPAIGHSLFCDARQKPPCRLACSLPLPPAVAEGIEHIEKRKGWNGPATPEYGMPTETWREVVARRQRCEELRAKLTSGEIHDINDLITLNLDICQFAEDVIDNCEGPELLRAFWLAIKNVSVLDPTCGSGAFLFAGLNLLEPLYDACLDRMHGFVNELKLNGKKHHPEKFSDFRKILEDVERHPNRRYFILKSIIVGNLYGVDIMEEAVEICKLRLFLKLVAQVEKVEQIEPLPDIDFNVRAGNTLVGFASVAQVKARMKGSLGFFQKDLDRIIEESDIVDRAFMKFRQMQTEHGMDATEFTEAKTDLRNRLIKLRGELDRYLAGEFDVDPDNPKEFRKWRESHQPFHWLAEFYGIMHSGGFDVIIGNPPYVEYKDVRSNYQVANYKTLECSNLFAFVLERCSDCAHESTRLGMIVPLSAFSTDRMVPLISHIKRSSSHLFVSNFGWRPGKLFDDVNLQLSILLQRIGQSSSNVFTSQYTLWDSQARPELFARIQYANVCDDTLPGSIPKIGCTDAASVLSRLRSRKEQIGRCFDRHGHTRVFYRRGGLYWKVFVDFETGSSEEKIIGLQPKIDRFSIISVLSSSLWFWYFQATSDCRHLGNRDINTFPIDTRAMSTATVDRLVALGREYVHDLRKNAKKAVRVYKRKKPVECLSFRVKDSKTIIDDIDRVLAKHFAFTDEELDFIINYDIKYRIGQEAEGDADE